MERSGLARNSGTRHNWYLSAQHSCELETRIVLSHAALERLSWHVCENSDFDRVAKKQGKRPSASEKFLRAFGALGIPSDIPRGTAVLKEFADREKCENAPRALAKIRNFLVHPDHRLHRVSSDVLTEAAKVALWYVELCVLAACEYSGTYGNRLERRWVGQVEKVPWAS